MQHILLTAEVADAKIKIGEHEFLCTPTGVSKGFMTPEQICLVDENGKLIGEKSGPGPSSEIMMHMRVYAKRDDVGAVVHTHPPYATSFAAAGRPLNIPISSESVVLLGCVPLAPFALPSTSEVPDSIERYLDDFDAVLLENHGVLNWSEDLMSAYMRMESLEFYAALLYRTEMLGGAKVFTKEQIEKLAQVRQKTGIKGRYPSGRIEKCYKCDNCFWRS